MVPSPVLLSPVGDIYIVCENNKLENTQKIKNILLCFMRKKLSKKAPKSGLL